MSQSPSKPAELSPLKRALLALDEMQARVGALEREASEPLAVVGLGCRHPGGVHDPEAFWRLLDRGVDAVRDVPPDRWDVSSVYSSDPEAPGKAYTRWGGFLDGPIDEFEPQFFGIAPREADDMDPQQRLLLEVSWEALEHAAQAPDRLGGSRTGVFVGICSGDYSRIGGFFDDPARANAYSASGIAHSVAPGRISYVLGLQGPSVAVDTACSSSLVALHLACQSLRLRECRMALAGGVHLMLAPTSTIVFCKSKMMSPSGRCRTFGEGADGFVLGEGCAVVVLRRLSDAEADGDRVLALVRGTAVNQDGASGGLTVPNGPSQEAVIAEALARAGVSPAEVDYVEAHGTGTPLGDPIEVRALANALGTGRPKDRPLLIGSAKSNFGHLEAAAGLTGFVKLVLALQHEKIPPHLHAETLSGHIPWSELPVEVVTGGRPWPRSSRPRIGGVSSFGFSGTNAHAVLEEAPTAAPKKAVTADRPFHLFAFSARGGKALCALAARHADHLAAHPEADLADVAFTANSGRAHLGHRCALLAGSLDELQGQLASVARGQTPARGWVGELDRTDRARVVFLFTGQGSQYGGMGRGLYATHPTFRRALDRCGEILGTHMEEPLLELLFDPSRAGHLDQTAYTQPCLFALEYALAELWRSWGLEPAAVLGHSVGEYVAACVAGVYGLEDGLKLIAARGRLMQTLPTGGAMAAVFAGEDRLAELLRPLSDRVSIAAVNAPQNTVISGDAAAVEALRARLKAEGIGSKPLAVSHAFHSPLMAPILGEFARVAAEVRYSAPKIPLVSNLTGERLKAGEVPDAAYWVRHLREPVRFAAGIEGLARRGLKTFIEIGPASTLSGLGRLCVPEGSALWVPTLRKGADDTAQVLSSLATLYVHGADVDWKGLDRDYPRRQVDLPTYPFQRKRHWVEGPKRSRAASSGGPPEAGAGEHPLLGRGVRSPLVAEVVFERSFSPESPGFVKDHRVLGRVVLPATAYFEMAAAAAEVVGVGPHRLEDIDIREALILEEGVARVVQLVLAPDGSDRHRFQVISLGRGSEPGFTVHATGSVRTVAPTDRAPDPPFLREEIEARCGDVVSREVHYQQMAERGLDFGPGFHGLDGVRRRAGEAVGRVSLPAVLAPEAATYSVHPALLDACVQVVGEALPDGTEDGIYMPMGLGSFQRFGGGSELWSHAVVRPGGGAGRTLSADVRVFDGSGALVAELRNLQLKRADPQALERGGREDLDDWLYEVRWRPQPLAVDPTVTPPEWLGSPARIAEAVAPEVARLASRHGLGLYDELLPQLDLLSAAYVASALGELGVRLRIGDRLSASALAEEAGVLDAHRRLLARMLEILEEDGWLRRDASGWEVVRVPEEGDGIPGRLAALREGFPGGPAELLFAERGGTHLADVLRGRLDPLQVLFPGGSFDLAEKLYEQAPAALVFNGLAREAVSAALASLPPGRTVRILEIGAGTGGTTSFVLPTLPSGRVEYTFTDMSGLFLARAEKKFAGYPFLRCRLLDLEQDPEAQGFAPHAFDLVIAANVVHATSDLRRTLLHVRRLLAPQGLLVMGEMTRPQRWVDLTFGMTEGWWKFLDTDLRPSYPLLPAPRWLDVLRAAGFEAAALPGEAHLTGPLSQNAVILARTPRLGDGVGAAVPERAGRWLVLADEGVVGQKLAKALETRGQAALLVHAVQGGGQSSANVSLDPERAEDFRRLLDGFGPDRPCLGIVHLWSLDTPLPPERPGASLEVLQRRSCGSVLLLVQALAGASLTRRPGLWLVTRGAQAAGERAPLVAASQAPLWGLGKVIALEHPELRCVRVDLDPSAAADDLGALTDEILGGEGEDEVAFRHGQRRVARLVRSRGTSARVAVEAPDADGPAAGPVQLVIATQGSLDGLVLRPLSRRRPGPGEVEIRVRATGLNFRDVLNALGMRHDEDPLGGECAGIVTAAGEEVEDLRVGDAVVAVTMGGFSSYVTTHSRLVLRRPEGLSFEQAATLPLAFLTAHYALHRVGRMARGERVLVHAAAGGVGMAAVQLARRAGAEVFATAGNPQKRAFLESMGVEHVMDSRTLGFADEVLERTKGEGVDLVLNSLIGGAIPKSLGVLKSGGRFLEIGKAEIWTPEQVARVRPGVSYFAIDLAEKLRTEPEAIRPLFAELLQRVAAGELEPLPMSAFPLEEASAAFRHMAQARHIGKVVVTQADVADRRDVRSDGTYLVTGGLGGLGLLVARWLVERGARHLVLMGRRDTSPAAREVIDELTGKGARIVAVQGDVSRAEDVARAIEETGRSLPPLRGVVHSAGVLDDGVLLQQRWERFATVMAPKVDGAWNLHAATKDRPLDFFVLFSSVSSFIGSAGQGNHAAANAFLDALAHLRRGQGLPGLSIGWGAWSEVGAAAERNVGDRIESRGVRTFTPRQGIEVLERLLLGTGSEGPCQVAVIPVDWSRFLRPGAGRAQPAPFFAELARQVRPAGHAGPFAPPAAVAAIRQRLEEAPANQRRKLLLEHVRGQAVKVLGLDPSEPIDPRQPLNELGLDSLMAVELRNLLGTGLGVDRGLPATLVFDYPSVADLADYLAREVLKIEETQVEARPRESAEPNILEQIEQLSEEDVDRLLSERAQRDQRP